MNYIKQSAIREGKSKILYSTQSPEYIIQFFKDDATAFNALKKGTIKNKGPINNQVSSSLFKYLEKNEIKTHFVKQLSSSEMLVTKLEIIPVEVVRRNRAAGSSCKRSLSSFSINRMLWEIHLSLKVIFYILSGPRLKN